MICSDTRHISQPVTNSNSQAGQVRLRQSQLRRCLVLRNPCNTQLVQLAYQQSKRCLPNQPLASRCIVRWHQYRLPSSPKSLHVIRAPRGDAGTNPIQTHGTACQKWVGKKGNHRPIIVPSRLPCITCRTDSSADTHANKLTCHDQLLRRHRHRLSGQRQTVLTRPLTSLATAGGD